MTIYTLRLTRPASSIKGHKECCQLLMNAGANPNIPDANGETALKYMQSQSIVNKF